jgi:hypothetical protein
MLETYSSGAVAELDSLMVSQEKLTDERLRAVLEAHRMMAG